MIGSCSYELDHPAPLTEPASATGAADGVSERPIRALDAPSADPAELEAIVRAGSAASTPRQRVAAALARGALVIQGGISFRLPDSATAARWNAISLLWNDLRASIVDGAVIAVVFALGDANEPCDAPPVARPAAAFLIEDSKIAVWQQIPVPEEASPEQMELRPRLRREARA